MLGSIAQYPGSACFYILLIAICCLLARGSEEWNKPYPLAIAVAVLTLVSALRDTTVGIDTPAYARAYYGLIPSYFEPGFTWLIQLFQPLGDYRFFFGAVALIIYGFTFARLWQLRNYCSMTLSVAIYLLVIFSSTWNGQRSCIVVAIMFYAMGFLEKRRLVPFFAAVALCITVHYSSVAFLLLFLAMPNWMDGLSRNKRTLIMLFLPVLVAVVVGALAWMVSSGMFERYFKEYSDAADAQRIGLSWYLYFALFFASLCMLRSEEKGSLERADTQSFLLYAALGIGLFISSLYWFGGGRISSYFNIYCTLVFARFWKVSQSYRYGLLYRAGVSVYCCYAFYQVLVSNGQGLLPYILG